jgi:glutamyl-tRNA synthetase
MPDERFYDLSIHALTRAGLDIQHYPVSYVKSALDTCKGKFKLFGELPAYAGFYFTDTITYDPEAARREFTPENKERLVKLRERLATLEPFDHDQVGATLAAVAKEAGVKTGILVHPTRLACCGASAGPSLYHLIAILGKARVLQRLDQALAFAP